MCQIYHSFGVNFQFMGSSPVTYASSVESIFPLTLSNYYLVPLSLPSTNIGASSETPLYLYFVLFCQSTRTCSWFQIKVNHHRLWNQDRNYYPNRGFHKKYFMRCQWCHSTYRSYFWHVCSVGISVFNMWFGLSKFGILGARF